MNEQDVRINGFYFQKNKVFINDNFLLNSDLQELAFGDVLSFDKVEPELRYYVGYLRDIKDLRFLFQVIQSDQGTISSF